MPPVGQAPGGAGPKVLVLAAVAALVLGLDVASKVVVVANLTEGEPVHVLGDIFEFTLLRNPGAAWNLGTGYTAVFTVLAIGVIAFVVRTARRLRSTGYAVAFGLILGGASGNLGDRIFRAPGIFRGNVVDWIGVVPRYYPVFNIADSAICIAAATFVVLALLGIHMDGSRGDKPVADQPESPDAPGAGPASSAHATSSPQPSPSRANSAEAER